MNRKGFIAFLAAENHRRIRVCPGGLWLWCWLDFVGGGRRKTHDRCFARNLLNYPAGQEHADVVEDGVQVDAKDQDVQVGVGPKRSKMDVVVQHHKQPKIDVKCRRGNDSKTGPQERQPLRLLQADLPFRTHVAHFTQDFEYRPEEQCSYHARKSCVLRQ